MTRDVYAGDQGPTPDFPTEGLVHSVRISIRAEAHPDILLRIAAPLNLFNAAPHEVHMRAQPDSTVRVDITMRQCSKFAVDRVCRKLAQLTCVLDVTHDLDTLPRLDVVSHSVPDT